MLQGGVQRQNGKYPQGKKRSIGENEVNAVKVNGVEANAVK